MAMLRNKKRKREHEKELIRNYNTDDNEFNRVNLKNMNDIILKIIDEIREVYRVNLHLYYNEGKSYNEIAEILDTSINNVKSNLRRAKQDIKHRLKKDYNIQD